VQEDDRLIQAALKDRLRRRGLAHKADAILGIAAPCIRLDTSKADDALLPPSGRQSSAACPT
jgi:hypothetical protein